MGMPLVQRRATARRCGPRLTMVATGRLAEMEKELRRAETNKGLL
jgi:hypothetical protein